MCVAKKLETRLKNIKAKIKATGEVAEIIGADQDDKTGEYKKVFLLNVGKNHI